MISILLVHANADACWCARKTLNTEEEFRTAVEKEFHNSTAVFSGEIVEWSKGKIRVKVNKKWKGEAAAEVTLSYLYYVVVKGETYIDGCSYESFKVGKSYLIYADSFENVLQVYGCSRTQPLNEADRDMKVLDDLKQTVERQLLSQRGLQLLAAKSNPSLDASGGSAPRNLRGAAKGALIRAAASTQPFDGLYSMATETSIDDDRTEWDNAWRSRPLRRLVNPIQIDVSPTFNDDWGAVTHVDIVSNPPQFADSGWRENDICPMCGRTTSGDSSRLAVTIYPYFSKGFSYGRGAWAHQSCFVACEEIPGPAPVPW